MTPERVVALLIALVPVLAIIASIVIAIINRPKPTHRPDQQQQPKPDQQPALGVTINDDHADDAIAALTDSRDLWKGRAEEYRDRLVTANAELRKHDLPTA